MVNRQAIKRPASALSATSEREEDRAKRLRLVYLPYQDTPENVPQSFTGKATINKEGLIAIDRSNRPDLRKDWEKRRKAPAPPPGGWPTPPAHWPEGVRVDLGTVVPWLPKGWGQGIKLSCVTKLQAFVSPQGKVYYHKHVVQQVLGKKLTGDGVQAWQKKFDDFRAKWEENLVSENLAEVTAWVAKQIGAGKTFTGKPGSFGAMDKRLFQELTKSERRYLPKAADLHVAVISARRASDAKSIKTLCNLQAQLTAGGASPVWYVDKPSLAAYKRIGLNARVGGKLVPARNLALEDAKRLKKACVQVSDDIQGWTYLGGKLNSKAYLDSSANALQAGNEAARHADELAISPVAAASFLLAKLRAAGTPKLAGVHPVSNPGMALMREAVSSDTFILGDFFVAEPSNCRFDPRMSLKEDYDFTCSHLDRHGSVLRCNRMLVRAVHETNAGGAVSERDSAGHKERENIKILQEKWPGVFHLNGKRGDTQVVMSWRRRRT
ncbi:unnamed protein product [Polarella glacialis]|uniref:Uncharacterized protein n=1 Tax=Polarella glacialis TaxID=89957 RepID=A0A813I413_POLGL|nr:unnamed protein product [Polarella glacialis]